MVTQKSKWAGSSIIATIFVLALMGGIGYSMKFIDPEIGVILEFAIWGLAVAMCVSALCFFPLATEVDDRALYVAMSLRTKILPLAEIASAKPYTLPRATIRTCGSGAFFGWWGWFRNKELGNFMMYAANLQNLILVEMAGGKKYVISCSDPETMVEAIMERKKML